MSIGNDVYNILAHLLPASRSIRRIRSAFRQGNAGALYELVRGNKRIIFSQAARWVNEGKLEGYQSLGVARAFEQVYSDDSLTLSLASNEPKVISLTRLIDELYHRVQASPSEVLATAEGMLIDIAHPTTHGQHLLVIDCLGLALKSLFALGKFSESDRMNSQGIAIAEKCLDLVSEKMFLQNRMIIEGKKASPVASMAVSTATRLVEIEHAMYGSS